ncbi:Peptidyl-tRNA hydrolase protein 2, mitochondrial [Clonorchis sinensis]|uniref:peptidyl-tRNA hydrolase n=2 Tax=Clonorchis sinensis TaxID=79923 RepID=A0A8T1M9W5_CLOSI|nr:Peptidyl-tRNA hydrolase protein 2, mitochondrial [Clonorchis sinensis]
MSFLWSSVLSGGLGVLIGWVFARRFSSTAMKTANIKPVKGRMKLVLVVRKDLNMGTGKIAAQCSHATLSCYEYARDVNPGLLESWVRQGQPKIVVKVDSAEDLHLLAAKADSLGLINSIIQDAGHTQVASGTETVLGIGPGPASEIDRVSGDLKLL